MRLIALLTIVAAPVLAQDEAANEGRLSFTARTRVETAKESGRYHTLPKQIDWNAKETAIVICDMWDKHWCPTATQRVACLLYTSPSPRDKRQSRMPSSA